FWKSCSSASENATRWESDMERSDSPPLPNAELTCRGGCSDRMTRTQVDAAAVRCSVWFDAAGLSLPELPPLPLLLNLLLQQMIRFCPCEIGDLCGSLIRIESDGLIPIRCRRGRIPHLLVEQRAVSVSGDILRIQADGLGIAVDRLITFALELVA